MSFSTYIYYFLSLSSVLPLSYFLYSSFLFSVTPSPFLPPPSLSPSLPFSLPPFLPPSLSPFLPFFLRPSFSQLFFLDQTCPLQSDYGITSLQLAVNFLLHTYFRTRKKLRCVHRRWLSEASCSTAVQEALLHSIICKPQGQSLSFVSCCHGSFCVRTQRYFFNQTSRLLFFLSIFLLLAFLWPLFEGGIYVSGKPTDIINDQVGYIQAV